MGVMMNKNLPLNELPVEDKKKYEWLLGKNWWFTDSDKLREKGYDPHVYMFAEDGEVIIRSDLNCWDDDLSRWEESDAN